MKRFLILLVSMLLVSCGSSESIDSGPPENEPWPVVVTEENPGQIFWASGRLEIEVNATCLDLSYHFFLVNQNTQIPVATLAFGNDLLLGEWVSVDVQEGYYQIIAKTDCAWVIRIFGNVAETT